MHGIFFNELKKYVDKNLGGDSWRNLLDGSNLGPRMYMPLKVYPDMEIFALVSAASKLTGLAVPVILRDFGKFIAPDLLLIFYRQIPKEWNLLDIVENSEETFHNSARLRNPGAKPPVLKIERPSSEQVTIFYNSSRRMCAAGIGLIEGIADLFEEPVTVDERTCMLRGDVSCTIDVKLEIPIQQAKPFSEVELHGLTVQSTPTHVNKPRTTFGQSPILIVGAGPVGIHAARQILKLAPDQSVEVYGAEPWEPYNRVLLSELLAGDIEWKDIANELKFEQRTNENPIHINTSIFRIDRIDRKNCCVVDVYGHSHPYSRLILAVGSRAYRVDARTKTSLVGIYTYRDVDDAQALLTNLDQSEHTVISGGGVLGIEVAFALKAQNPETEITIVHRSDRLMNRQLDNEASEFLLKQVHASGIKVLLNTTIDEFIGTNELTAIRLDNGELLPCDMLVSCQGIVANTLLAEDAGLQTSRGIIVNDFLQTSDPNIYAIGECAEHRGKVVGLLEPGIEQATIAARNILFGEKNRYSGANYSLMAKVKNLPVFSLQKTGSSNNPCRKLIFEKKEPIRFREVILDDKNRLVGATAIGEWPEFSQVRQELDNDMRVGFLQRRYFLRTGSLWPAESLKDPIEWPADTVVCSCGAITRGEIGAAMEKGCVSLADLQLYTGAAQGCGLCKPILEKLLGRITSTEVVPFRGSLLVVTILALSLLAGYLLPAVKMPQTMADNDMLRRLMFSNGWRQVTGYTTIGLIILGFGLSLNKRCQILQFASYSAWQVMHVVLAAFAITVLLFHTNLGWGEHFNFKVQGLFIATILSGTVLGLIFGLDGGFFGAMLTRYRVYWLRLHIILAWCFVGLVSLHILSVYYF